MSYAMFFAQLISPQLSNAIIKFGGNRCGCGGTGVIDTSGCIPLS